MSKVSVIVPVYNVEKYIAELFVTNMQRKMKEFR